MSDDELVEALAVEMWSAALVLFEPDWMRDNPSPPNVDDWIELNIEPEREPWRKIARKLINTVRGQL